jgi:hypothetical protein
VPCEDSHKRPRMAMDQMLLQMTGMGLASLPEPHRSHAVPGLLAPKKHRFKKVNTITSLSTFDSKTAEEVHVLLASWAATAATKAGTQAPASAPSSLIQGGVRRVYKHVRSTRQKHPDGHPSSSFSASGSSFLVLDVEVMDTEGEASASGARSDDKKQTEEEARRKVLEEERERKLATTFLPMVGDYLEGGTKVQEAKASQRKVPSSSKRAGGKVDKPLDAAEPMEFVYDVYLPSAMEDEGSTAPDEHDESTPVVHVEEDEMWYADPVDDGSEAGKTEDSNAESFYANSYPEDEEEEEWGDEDLEGEYEDGENGGDQVYHHHQGMKRVQGRFGAEEYDLDEDEEEEEQVEEKEKVSWRSKLIG